MTTAASAVLFRFESKGSGFNANERLENKLPLLCFFVQCENEIFKAAVNRKIKKLPFFRLVLSQNNPFRRPFRTLLIKNWMNPEFEICLMEDF